MMRCAAAMSASRPEADIRAGLQHVCFVPNSGLMHRSKPSLFDHLIGAGKQRWRDFEAERFGRLQIDDEIEFGWLFDRRRGGIIAKPQRLLNSGKEATAQTVTMTA
jgi:hypothetical protein